MSNTTRYGQRQIQRRPTHTVTPHLRTFGEPGAHRVDLATSDDIEQLPVFHVNDLRRPALAPVAALALVERLVQPHRTDRAVAGRVVDQQLPEQHDRIVDGVPIAGEIIGDFGHRPARVVSADRADAIVGSCSLQVTTTHDRVGQRHRCLRHANRVGRPNAGRSTSSTSRWP